MFIKHNTAIGYLFYANTFSNCSSTSTCVIPRFFNEVDTEMLSNKSTMSSAVSGLLLISKCSNTKAFFIPWPKILPTSLKLSTNFKRYVYLKLKFITCSKWSAFVWTYAIYLFQLISSTFSPSALVIKFLNMFAHSLPDNPFHCNINTRKFWLETSIVLIKGVKTVFGGINNSYEIVL